MCFPRRGSRTNHFQDFDVTFLGRPFQGPFRTSFVVTIRVQALYDFEMTVPGRPVHRRRRISLYAVRVQYLDDVHRHTSSSEVFFFMHARDRL
jgi:hypothetical protein